MSCKFCRVERIYEDIQASIKDRKIHHDFQLNKLSLVITRVTALLGILVSNLFIERLLVCIVVVIFMMVKVT